MHSRSEVAALDAPPGTALWNPSAAIAWSLVFTPAFGAWILMHNWRLLGDEAQARIARRWLVAALVLLGLRALAEGICARLHAEPVLLQWAALLFALAWATGCALPQVRAIKLAGEAYPRRAWDGPLVAALLAGCAYTALAWALRWLFIAAT